VDFTVPRAAKKNGLLSFSSLPHPGEIKKWQVGCEDFLAACPESHQQMRIF
jgi:hypothetical protein